MRNIVFVSEIQDPEVKGSSTQIMTRNILEGFKLNNYRVTFIAITDDDCNDESVIRNFSSLVERIKIIKSKSPVRLTSNKYAGISRLLSKAFIKNHYRNLVKEINVEDNSIVISHSPSIDSILISSTISRINKLKYLQYWSDPIAISGIYPENFSYKRIPHYIVERKMLRFADEIIYGTETLYKFQKKLFKKFSSKMRYVDISYSESNKTVGKNHNKSENIVTYTGSYKRNVRNIVPLYNSIQDLSNMKLLIYGDSDIQLKSEKNITVKNKRFSQNDIKIIEEKADILVGVLNSSCIQIPGKIFYHTNTDKVILIILDGKYKEEIKRYLEKFQRFEFCDNNEESIRNTLMKIQANNYSVNLSKIKLLSPKYIGRKIVMNE